MEMRLKSSTACLLLAICSLLILMNDIEAAPQKSAATESPFPVATVIPWVKKPVTRYAESYEDYEEESSHGSTSLKSPSFTPPQLILTLMRTVADVLKGMNEKRLQTNTTKRKVSEAAKINVNHSNITIVDKASIDKSSNSSASAGSRGMDHEVSYDDIIHDDHHHYHPEPAPVVVTTQAPKEMVKQSRYSDPWSGYYDFIITEGSFKFWSFFQLFTAGVLLYSALAAVYYAKFNPIQPDYDTTYDDYFFGRSLEGDAPQADSTSATPAPGWLSSITGSAFQRIMDTVSSLEDKYSTKQ